MADSPLEGEATQALFCAVADYVGKAQIDKVLDLEKYPTYQSFLKRQAKLPDIHCNR